MTTDVILKFRCPYCDVTWRSKEYKVRPTNPLMLFRCYQNDVSKGCKGCGKQFVVRVEERFVDDPGYYRHGIFSHPHKIEGLYSATTVSPQEEK